jgi:hypothetical protein
LPSSSSMDEAIEASKQRCRRTSRHDRSSRRHHLPQCSGGGVCDRGQDARLVLLADARRRNRSNSASNSAAIATPGASSIRSIPARGSRWRILSAAATRKDRRIHLPVAVDRTDTEYSEPLRTRDCGGGTELYLGLAGMDGVKATKRRIAAAIVLVADFDIANKCDIASSRTRRHSASCCTPMRSHRADWHNPVNDHRVAWVRSGHQ